MTPPINESPAHGTAIAVDGRGLLIVGASGSGKSGLALELIALGATLVSDDRVKLTTHAGAVEMSASESIAGLIEARHIGILHCPPSPPVLLTLIVDLSSRHAARLPQGESLTVLDVEIPLIRGRDVPNLAAALMVTLRHGRVEPNTSA